jgi:zinc transporter 9
MMKRVDAGASPTNINQRRVGFVDRGAWTRPMWDGARGWDGAGGDGRRDAWRGFGATRGFRASASTGLDVNRKGHRENEASRAKKAQEEEGTSTEATEANEYDELPRGSGAEAIDEANDKRALKAVHTAIGCNTAILVCKLGAYGVSGSPSMLAESIHSVADIVNQALLQVGITNSNRKPDAAFNYGYRRERFVYSLISAVGIFFLGAGFSVMHGIHGVMDPMPAENISIGIAVLAASAALEAFSLKVAYESLRDNAHAQGMTLTEFVKSGKDPTSVSVVAEDAAAVLGCGIAGTALLAAQATGNPIYDACGSIAVGGLLGVTAMYLINSNRLLLLGRSLGADKMQAITEHMRRDPVVEEVYFAKSEELGAGTYRFAAEVEFSGKKIVERYLAKNKRRMELHSKFNEASLSANGTAMDAALAHYGEEIVQAVGDEVDRMEKEIVKIEPSIHYVDIETN